MSALAIARASTAEIATGASEAVAAVAPPPFSDACTFSKRSEPRTKSGKPVTLGVKDAVIEDVGENVDEGVGVQVCEHVLEGVCE